MYSKYDDPDYRPIPGEREKDRLRALRARHDLVYRELMEIEAEIRELESRPYVLDNPLPTE